MGESAVIGLDPLALGFGERCCRGAVTLGGGGPATVMAGTPEPPFPPSFPAVSEPVAAHHLGGNAPRVPPTSSCRRREEWRGSEGGRLEGSGGTGSGKDPPGCLQDWTQGRAESSQQTTRTPPIYLLTVSSPLELSLQSSFQLSL